MSRKQELVGAEVLDIEQLPWGSYSSEVNSLGMWADNGMMWTYVAYSVTAEEMLSQTGQAEKS